MIQWPALRRAQRQNGHLGTVSSKKTVPLLAIRHAISPVEYEGIITNRIPVVVFGAVRYTDGSGIHELAICRYLQPPFDREHWKTYERLDGKTYDIIEAQIPIQVAVDPAGALPLHIPPTANVWLLSFTDRKEASILWSRGGALNMPTASPPMEIHGEQFVNAIRITNHGTVAVLNLNSMLQFEFREGAAANSEDTIKKVIDSPNLGTRSLPLSIESLGPNEEATVFLVNQSRYSIVLRPLLVS